MGLFDKKKKYALSDILKGLYNAVGSAQEMLQAKQVQNLTRFWQTDDGKPLSQTLRVGNREMNVPLISLVSHSHLEMEDVEIKFKARIGDVASHSMHTRLDGNNVLNHSDLHLEMEGIKATDNDVMDITIRFKLKDTPEGVARLSDEYNKLI